MKCHQAVALPGRKLRNVTRTSLALPIPSRRSLAFPNANRALLSASTAKRRWHVTVRAIAGANFKLWSPWTAASQGTAHRHRSDSIGSVPNVSQFQRGDIGTVEHSCLQGSRPGSGRKDLQATGRASDDHIARWALVCRTLQSGQQYPAKARRRSVLELTHGSPFRSQRCCPRTGPTGGPPPLAVTPSARTASRVPASSQRAWNYPRSIS